MNLSDLMGVLNLNLDLNLSDLMELSLDLNLSDLMGVLPVNLAKVIRNANEHS